MITKVVITCFKYKFCIELLLDSMLTKRRKNSLNKATEQFGQIHGILILNLLFFLNSQRKHVRVKPRAIHVHTYGVKRHGILGRIC